MSALLLSALLSACGGSPAPSTPEAPTGEAPAGEAPAAEAGAVPPTDAAAATAVAPPTAAMPGPPVEASATPGVVTTPSGGRPAPKGFKVEQGAAVAVAGKVTWTGTTKGVLRLDVLHNVGVGQPPELMYTQEMKGSGAFRIEVPPDAGALTVTAYVDTNNNGPELTEPQARSVEVNVAGAGVSDLELVVSERADLSKTGPDGSKISPPTP